MALAAAAALTSGCGSSPPTTPAATPAAPPARTYSVSGTVTDLTGALPIASAQVLATDGPDRGRSVSTDSTGRYTFDGLVAGPTTLRALARNYAAADAALAIPTELRADFRLPGIVPPPGAPLRCDATLWSHMHDVQRIKMVRACQTVTGTIASVHSSDDGDVDMQLTLDAPFAGLLNATNIANLNGNLQIEAICQVPVHADVPDAQRTCAGFTGTVPIPAVGTRVQVTGVYVLDSDHGWMELHPISVLTLAP